MSIPKMAGLETEFAVTGGEPMRASKEIVRAYRWISLDPEGDATSPRQKTGNVCIASMNDSDLMLPNGARFYVDHSHPEYSTPETIDPCRVVAVDRAGTEILWRCADLVSRMHPDRNPLRIYKNNSDHQGNSYGCHENYLLDVNTYVALFNRKAHWIYGYLAPFLVSRIVYTGAGKVGAENGTDPVEYQLSQRADFLEQVVGLQTTYQRPIVNTRDEPHADPARFRRLHVIAGDANMCPYAAWLKVGTMQILLRLLEDGALTGNLYLADPVLAIRQISRDRTCKLQVRLEDGRELTAIEIQRAFLECARRYFDQHAPSEPEAAILQAWEETLLALSEDPRELAGKLDWVTKRQIIAAIAAKEGWQWGDAQALEADVKYHAVDPREGIFLQLERLGLIIFPPGWDAGAAASYLREPPADTRAYLRGGCIRKFASEILRADWGEIHFDSGELQLPDPLAMDQRSVGQILAESSRAPALLETLDGLVTNRSRAAAHRETGDIK